VPNSGMPNVCPEVNKLIILLSEKLIIDGSLPVNLNNACKIAGSSNPKISIFKKISDKKIYSK